MSLRPLSHTALVSQWNAIPLSVRIAVLTVSIQASDESATAAVRNLIATASILSEQLGEIERATIAALMREVADEVERPRLLN